MNSDERRLGESQLEWERRIISKNERQNAAPRMNLKFPMDTDFSKAVVPIIYPGSEIDEKGQISVIKKDNHFPTEYIYLEIKDKRFKFRFTGEGTMNFEDDVMTLDVEFRELAQ